MRFAFPSGRVRLILSLATRVFFSERGITSFGEYTGIFLEASTSTLHIWNVTYTWVASRPGQQDLRNSGGI